MNQYPSDAMIRSFEEDPNLTTEDCEKLRPKYLGPLFSINFYRVVLDEATAIKNHTSRRYYRSMSTRFLGHALFELPQPHALDPITVNLSREETLIYRRVESIFRQRVLKQLKALSWLIFILRLRQAVSHPFLLESVMKDEFEPEDTRWLITELSRIGLWCEEQLQVRDTKKVSLDTKHEGLLATFDMVPQLERVTKPKKGRVQDLCQKCGVAPEDPFHPKCGHVFCEDCIKSSIAEEATAGSGTHGCRECSKLMMSIRKSMEQETGNRGPRNGPSTIKPRHRGDDMNRIQPIPSEESQSTFLAESDREPLKMLTPSTKTIVLKSMLMEWCKCYPTDKIMVFTSFVNVGRIIGRMLQDADIDFLYYFGSMSQIEMYKAVQDFRSKENIRALVASIQCSGQALNLECANRVIIFDLWWNAAMKQQAFGRVHRLGQKKKTYFAKIMVKNSVNERLATLQLKKLKAVEQAVKEHDSSDSTLTAEEIASLLGRVVLDEAGNIVDIESDYDDDETDQDDEGANCNGGTTGSGGGSDGSAQYKP
ncbi:P-loop containing nucleoside triphosphate hydrolase protein [Achaetomium macrosporum]|uniref:P-loop containing nucleoside triphosphate hydrolase protein n=1 Tax=Achaetomium macrosporum TaxID=79813 RepID=A0AAN7C4G8_9PEZI|nr:P-loop containing nucleoside triphosphate hydrolase protein [Achaetomium macrosporum]